MPTPLDLSQSRRLFICLAALLSLGLGAHAEERKKENSHAAPHHEAAAPHVEVRHEAAAPHGEVRREAIHERHEEAMHREAMHEHREAVREHYLFHEHDVHRFAHADLVRWRGGHWNNSCRAGRCGWWWFAEGQWYFYERPIYPYPLAVSPVTFMEPVEVAPAVVVAAPTVVARVVQAAPPMPVQAPPKFLYYCDNPKGYYPQVPSCPTGYREVSAR